MVKWLVCQDHWFRIRKKRVNRPKVHWSSHPAQQELYTLWDIPRNAIFLFCTFPQCFLGVFSCEVVAAGFFFQLLYILQKRRKKKKKHIYTLTSLCTLEKKQDIGTTKSSLCQEPLFYAFHHLFLCQIKFTFGYRISSRLDQKVYKDVFHQHLLFLPNVKVWHLMPLYTIS